MQDDRIKMEKRNVALLANSNLSSDELELFNQCRKLQRMLAHKGKVFLVWSRVEGKAKIHCKIRVNNFFADSQIGFGILLDVLDLDGELIGAEKVGHVPVQIHEFNLMAHTPTLPEVAYRPAPPDYLFNLHSHIVFRSEGDPEQHTDDKDFVSDVRSFLEFNPEYTGTRF